MQNTTTKQCETVTESRDVTGINSASSIGLDLHNATVTLRAVDSSESIINSLTIFLAQTLMLFTGVCCPVNPAADSPC